MTMTDTRTARPEPPAWFNLSAIVDAGLIAELATIADEAAALEPQVRAVAIRAFRALVALGKAVEAVSDTFPDDASDGVHAAIDDFTGATRLRNLLREMTDHLAAAHLDPGNHPDWLAEEVEVAKIGGRYFWAKEAELAAQR